MEMGAAPASPAACAGRCLAWTGTLVPGAFTLVESRAAPFSSRVSASFGKALPCRQVGTMMRKAGRIFRRHVVKTGRSQRSEIAERLLLQRC